LLNGVVGWNCDANGTYHAYCFTDLFIVCSDDGLGWGLNHHVYWGDFLFIVQEWGFGVLAGLDGRRVLGFGLNVVIPDQRHEKFLDINYLLRIVIQLSNLNFVVTTSKLWVRGVTRLIAFVMISTTALQGSRSENLALHQLRIISASIHIADDHMPPAATSSHPEELEMNKIKDQESQSQLLRPSSLSKRWQIGKTAPSSLSINFFSQWPRHQIKTKTQQ
jgi:hypothetical protein